MIVNCLRREYFQHANLILECEEELVYRFLYYFGASLSEYPDGEELARAKADLEYQIKNQPERLPEWLPKQKEITTYLLSQIDQVVVNMAPRVTRNGVEQQPLLKKYNESYASLDVNKY